MRKDPLLAHQGPAGWVVWVEASLLLTTNLDTGRIFGYPFKAASGGEGTRRERLKSALYLRLKKRKTFLEKT